MFSGGEVARTWRVVAPLPQRCREWYRSMELGAPRSSIEASYGNHPRFATCLSHYGWAHSHAMDARKQLTRTVEGMTYWPQTLQE